MPVNTKELIDDGYIVICDTNVYLHIYHFSPEFSDFALRCMQAIQSDIIMPSTVDVYKRQDNRCFIGNYS